MKHLDHPPARREDSFMRKLFLTIFFCTTITVSFAQKQYDLVKDFGAKPDNRTDNYAAFVKAATAISKEKTGILNIPYGKYYIAKYKVYHGKDSNAVGDIFFRNCKNLTINGNGSTIRLNGSFTRSSDYSIAGSGFRYAYKNTVCPFVISNCKNVLIRDLVLDGGVRNMKKEAVAEGECQGIMIDDAIGNDGESKDISIINCAANYFATDGFYIRCFGKNIKLTLCSGKCNARQGLSIVAGKDILVDRCTFDSTGFTGDYGWHGPGAGIDVENEWGEGKLKNVLIKNCQLRSNKGFQIVTTLQSEDITIDSCFIADLTYGRSDALNGVGMYSLNSILQNCIIFGSIQVDLAGQIYRGTVLQRYLRNVVYSGKRGILSSDFARSCVIAENIFIMLPDADKDDYFPYIQNLNCAFNENIIMAHASKVSARKNLPGGLVQGAREIKNDLWLINGYAAKEKGQKAYYYSITMNGGAEPLNQYFPENNWVKTLPFAFVKFLDKKAVDKISAYPLFTAYTQRSLDLQYLNQAKEIRAYFQKIRP